VARGDGKLTHELFGDERAPQDACGVFGVWAPGEDVAKLTYFGLYALQHRGQESAGIAVSDGHHRCDARLGVHCCWACGRICGWGGAVWRDGSGC